MNRSIITIFVLFAAITATTAQNKFAGGDISMLPKYEAAKVKYTDQDGKQITDLLGYFCDKAGFNIARVRVFVNPTGETGVVQDTEYAVALSKRIKEAGMSLLFDFHYSDTWADPANQWTPAAWGTLSDEDLQKKIYEYTKDVLGKLVAAGATPDYIQTGNEISYGMLWGVKGTKTPKKCNTSKDDNWDRFNQLLSQAGKACREVCPDAKIIIHTERTNNWSTTKGIYERLAKTDYDIIGLSYYPEWHNNLYSLKSILNSIHTTFADKQVMIVETGYYNNWYPENATYDFTSDWPASAAGQKKFLDELVATVKDLDYMQGILYWFPEENPYNNHVYEPWYNHGLFNPNTGKVSEALFSLQTLRGVNTGIEDLTIPTGTTLSDDSNIYAIDGRVVANAASLPHGIYIQNGRKIVK